MNNFNFRTLLPFNLQYWVWHIRTSMVKAKLALSSLLCLTLVQFSCVTASKGTEKLSWTSHQALVCTMMPSMSALSKAITAANVCGNSFATSGYCCAGAAGSVKGSFVTITITTYKGCSPSRRVYSTAYSALKNSANFSDVFVDRPRLKYKRSGISSLTIPLKETWNQVVTSGNLSALEELVGLVSL